MRLLCRLGLAKIAIIAVSLITLLALAFSFSFWLQPVGATSGGHTAFLPAIFKSYDPPSPGTLAAPYQFGYGMIANQSDDGLVKQMGFNWVKINLSWKVVEGSKGIFYWKSYDDAVNTARSDGFLILMRVDDSPQWASNSTQYNAPPVNNSDLADFMSLVAQRYAGHVQAYEIWNEPNLSGEWGGQYPDPIKFGQMLQALYPKVKQADPNALVVSGGLSTTGDTNLSTAYSDTQYLIQLFCPGSPNVNISACTNNNGFGNYMDAVGSHPYGGPYAPQTDPSQAPEGTYFRRAEQQEQMIQLLTGTAKQIWATEFGYLIDPSIDGSSCNQVLDQHFVAMELSEQLQADYLVGAYQYAQANWPWMGPMFIMDLDFDMPPPEICQATTFFSILKPDGTPRPAYTALSSMAKSLSH